MKHNQALELHPHLSKLLDSFCFQLAVNIPDDNSLSLLEILDMRKQQDINDEEFKQLYIDWLESKNIYDLFTAKQVRVFSKAELLSNSSLSKYLDSQSILGSLQLLNSLYNDLYLQRKHNQQKLLQDTEKLFDNLDTNGNIHLGLSPLFFLISAIIIQQNSTLPLQYIEFMSIFRKKIKDFCEVEGMVSLRWFKNYFLFRGGSSNYPRQLLSILQDIQKCLKKGDSSRIKGEPIKLPDILSEAMNLWRNTARFNGIFQSKKKKFQIYQRIFMENQELFFFHSKEQIHVNSFIKKYGQSYIKSVQLDTNFIREFAQILHELLSQYLATIAKASGMGGKQKSQTNSAIFQTPSHQSHSTHNIYQDPYTYNTNKSGKMHHKKTPSAVYQATGKTNQNSSFKERTPTKKQKGHQTKRFNVTPTHKNTKMSPLIRKNFGSTDKSRSKSRNMTPTKSHTGGYSSLYPQTAQVYRNSKKEGLQKDSFFEKLFFFRNKRVESYDIVMKRLRGR